MRPDIRWIIAVYWPPTSDCQHLTHIGVPATARNSLCQMVSELSAIDGLVALYLPEGTGEEYDPQGNRGRIVGLVKLVQMPAGKKMEDYSYSDFDGRNRWPIGWPCKMLYQPEAAKGPRLREHVESLFGPGTFGSYVSRLHKKGPFKLEDSIRERLNRDFVGM